MLEVPPVLELRVPLEAVDLEVVVTGTGFCCRASWTWATGVLGVVVTGAVVTRGIQGCQMGSRMYNSSACSWVKVTFVAISMQQPNVALDATHCQFLLQFPLLC